LEGEFNEDKFNGKAIYYFTSGDKFEENGLRNGKRIFYYANGNKYKEEYKSAEMNGKGICHYTNGDKYEGEEDNNNRVL